MLKWITTLVPALAVFAYETARHDLLDRALPVGYGNLLVGLLALVLAYGFSEVVSGIVERLQARAVARSRELAALPAARAYRRPAPMAHAVQWMTRNPRRRRG